MFYRYKNIRKVLLAWSCKFSFLISGCINLLLLNLVRSIISYINYFLHQAWGTMRFKKGTQVEVFSNKDGPSGSWRRAEIVSGNGHSYMVRCDGCATVLEKISRKKIRPCPPSPAIANNWVAGDVVEVLDCFSWKMATISKVLGKKYFLVRLLGSSLEFQVSQYGIRARQSWQDDKWIVIGKGSVSCEDRKHNGGFTLNSKENSRKHIQLSERKIDLRARDGCFSEINKVKFLVSNTPSNKILKRRHYSHLQVEAYDGAPHKLRAIEKEGGVQRVFISNQTLQPVKVDTVSFPVEKVGRIHIHTFDNRTRLSVLEAERRKSADAVGCLFASRDAHSVTSSVGSCGITSHNPDRLRSHSGFLEDFNSSSSDAESCYRGEYEEGNILSTEEELAAEIHRLELYAYRCTMEALHASGPLSWEQESMVTNLRLSLHISNDEHLMEHVLRWKIAINGKKSIPLTFHVEAVILETWDGIPGSSEWSVKNILLTFSCF